MDLVIKEPTAQQKTGKGTEYLTGLLISQFFGIPFNSDTSSKIFETNKRCYEFWKNESPSKVSIIDHEIRDYLIPQLQAKYQNQKIPKSWWFNSDESGCSGDVRDIVFEDDIWHGLSLKNNNNEVKSVRHRNDAGAYTTMFGMEPSEKFVELFKSSKDIYPSSRILFSDWIEKLDYYHGACESVIEEMRDILIDDKRSSIFVNHVNDFIFGLNHDVDFVKFNKKGKCSFEIGNHPPVVSFLEVQPKYMGKKYKRTNNPLGCSRVISTIRLSFEDNKRNIIWLNIRVKNGNRHTRSRDGSAYGLKTAITKHLI